MSEYEQTQAVSVPPDEAFAWLSDVGNLPEYLPPVTNASIEGSSEGDNPGQKVRTTLQYPGGEGSFDAEGYLAVDEGARRMEWGAETGRDYSGWFEVTPDGDRSHVTVHLSFGERSVEPEMREETGGDEDPLADGISATLESIRRQLEERTGKVESSPPPDADPQTGDIPGRRARHPPDGR
jgi:ribosome-associated toxin RatA of RatAB toxin-antitoxin module